MLELQSGIESDQINSVELEIPLGCLGRCSHRSNIDYDSHDHHHYWDNLSSVPVSLFLCEYCVDDMMDPVNGWPSLNILTIWLHSSIDRLLISILDLTTNLIYQMGGFISYHHTAWCCLGSCYDIWIRLSPCIIHYDWPHRKIIYCFVVAPVQDYHNMLATIYTQSFSVGYEDLTTRQLVLFHSPCT